MSKTLPAGLRPHLNARGLRDLPGWAVDLVAGSLVVCAFLVFITKPLPVDPMMYLQEAQSPLQPSLNVGTARLLLLLPVSLASSVFGFSEAAFYLVPLGFAFIFGAATSALGRQVFSPAVGLAAALVAASGPFILPYGTQLLPDIGSAALLTASLVFVYRASRESEAVSHRDSLVAGLLFGCAYLVKETSLIFAPAFLAAALLLHVRAKGLITMVLGSLVAPALEIPIGWILWDDPLFRLDALTGRGAPLSDESQRGQISFEAQTNLFSSFRVFSDLMWRSVYGKLILVGSGVFGIVAAVARKRSFVALTTWILVAWSAFAVVGTIKPSGRLLIRLLLERYWAFLIPALAIAVVGVLVMLVERLTRSPRFRPPLRGLVALAIGGFVVFGGLASFDSRGDWFMRFGNDGYWELRSSFASMGRHGQLQVASRYANLIRLYTVDPVGEPITSIEIVQSSTDPEWILISESDLVSDSSPSEGIGVPISDSYQVFAAETTHPEWVMLTTQTDQASPTEPILDIGVSGAEWLGRTIKDGSWSDPFALSDSRVLLESTDELIVYDSSASYGQPNATSPVAPGTLIELRLQLHSVEGRVSVFCHFHDPSGHRIDVRAMSVLQGDEDGGRLTAFCRAPTDAGEQVVRPVLVVSGPGLIQFGTGRLLAPNA